MENQKTHVVLVNLGSPERPDAEAVRAFLAEFLWDPKVVNAPRVLWFLILNLFILPFRPARVARLYHSIWTEKGSPLVVHTQTLVEKLQEELGDQYDVCAAMTYGQPSIESSLHRARDMKAENIICIPLYPQYSETTTGAVLEKIKNWQERNPYAGLKVVREYHDHPAYIKAIGDSILQQWQAAGTQGHLLLSYHGIPLKYYQAGDKYPEYCKASAQLIADYLNLQSSQWSFAFQSRFGPMKWIEPYTDERLKNFASENILTVDVVCPGFAMDCLETLEEIDRQNKKEFFSSGGETFSYIPALNSRMSHVELLLQLINKK